MRVRIALYSLSQRQIDGLPVDVYVVVSTLNNLQRCCDEAVRLIYF